MPTGTVKWFNDAKGFGFIEPEAGGEDIFAHFSAIQMDGFRTLKQGGRVSYDVLQGPKGDQAQNIQAAEEAVSSPAAALTATGSPSRNSSTRPLTRPSARPSRATPQSAPSGAANA